MYILPSVYYQRVYNYIIIRAIKTVASVLCNAGLVLYKDVLSTPIVYDVLFCTNGCMIIAIAWRMPLLNLGKWEPSPSQMQPIVSKYSLRLEVHFNAGSNLTNIGKLITMNQFRIMIYPKQDVTLKQCANLLTTTMYHLRFDLFNIVSLKKCQSHPCVTRSYRMTSLIHSIPS